MNPESWQKVKEIFGAALARPTTERAAFLDQACGGDKSLQEEVESLLHSHQGAERFMETPAIQSFGSLALSYVMPETGPFQKETRHVGMNVSFVHCPRRMVTLTA